MRSKGNGQSLGIQEEMIMADHQSMLSQRLTGLSLIAPNSRMAVHRENEGYDFCFVTEQN